VVSIWPGFDAVSFILFRILSFAEESGNADESPSGISRAGWYSPEQAVINEKRRPAASTVSLDLLLSMWLKFNAQKTKRKNVQDWSGYYTFGPLKDILFYGF
jgi:hypothetical protein